MSGTWYNADGLVIRYPEFYSKTDPHVRNRLRKVVTEGVEQQLILEFDLSLLADTETTFTTDRDNDGALDGFTMGDPFIPAGSVILSADVFMTGTAAAGGTSIAVGTYQEDGTAIDVDGLVTTTNGATANLTARDRAIGTGAQISDATGEAGVAENAWVGLVVAGTFTAGKGAVVVKYVLPT